MDPTLELPVFVVGEPAGDAEVAAARELSEAALQASRCAMLLVDAREALARAEAGAHAAAVRVERARQALRAACSAPEPGSGVVQRI